MKTIFIDPDRNLSYQDQIISHKNTWPWQVATFLASQDQEQRQPIYEPEFLFGPGRIWSYSEYDKKAHGTSTLWETFKKEFGIEVFRENDCKVRIFADFRQSELNDWLAIPELTEEAKFIWTTKSFPFYRSIPNNGGILVNQDKYLELTETEAETLEMLLINMGYTISKSYVENVLKLDWRLARLRIKRLRTKLIKFLKADNIISSLYLAYRLDFPILSDPLTVDFNNFTNTYILWKYNNGS